MDLEFWLGIVIGIICGLIYGAGMMRKLAQAERRHLEKEQKRRQAMRERMQAPLHIPDDEGVSLAQAIKDAQGQQRPKLRVVS